MPLERRHEDERGVYEEKQNASEADATDPLISRRPKDRVQVEAEYAQDSDGP